MIAKRDVILCWALFLGIIFINGCQTAKGAAYGTGATVASAAKGIGAIAQGAASDTVSLYQGILKLDNWIKKNLW